MKFTTKDGRFDFKRAEEILTDVAHGHLASTTSDVQSGNSMMVSGGGTGHQDKLKSSIESILRIMGDLNSDKSNRDYILQRMEKQSGTLTKLSDQYALEDDEYSHNYHNEVLKICQGITDAQA